MYIRSLEYPDKQRQIADRMIGICESGQYAEGVWVAKATEAVAAVVKKPTVLVSSCGSALYAMYRWYGIHGHTAVAVQNNTFFATGAMAHEAGLIPFLVDSRPDDPSMSVDSLREVVARNGTIRLVCLTHVGGWVAKDYDLIAQFCKERRLTLVEDCAHAFAVPRAGQHGEMACWSFYATKAVPIGEGGALSCDKELPFEFVQLFASYGKWKDTDGTICYTRGMNLRMSEWHAAVLYTQLEHLDAILRRRTSDAVALQSIAPCLLSGATNWYKYPVAAWHAKGLKKVGKVYARSDQLYTSSCGASQQTVPLNNSLQWADNHVCLPIGEGLYQGLNEVGMQRALHGDTTD
jgi:dTDP-4-amino-4,6-dideoxygalactose transaminase